MKLSTILLSTLILVSTNVWAYDNDPSGLKAIGDQIMQQNAQQSQEMLQHDAMVKQNAELERMNRGY